MKFNFNIALFKNSDIIRLTKTQRQRKKLYSKEERWQ